MLTVTQGIIVFLMALVAVVVDGDVWFSCSQDSTEQ